MSVQAMKGATPRADQLVGIWAAVVEAIEAALNAIVTDENAKSILTALEKWVNSLLGVGDQAQALTELHQLGDGKLIGVLVKLIGGMAGNASGLGALVALIQSLIAGLKKT